MYLSLAINYPKDDLLYFEKHRDYGFKNSLVKTKAIAGIWNMQREFRIASQRKIEKYLCMKKFMNE